MLGSHRSSEPAEEVKHKNGEGSCFYASGKSRVLLMAMDKWGLHSGPQL